MFGKELFIWFTMRVSECLFVCVYASFPFGFHGRVKDFIVLTPGHCLSVRNYSMLLLVFVTSSCQGL